MSRLVEALRELVALKDLRERLRHLFEMGHATDYDDYYRRKPLAWAEARAALAEAEQPVQEPAVAPRLQGAELRTAILDTLRLVLDEVDEPKAYRAAILDGMAARIRVPAAQPVQEPVARIEELMRSYERMSADFKNALSRDTRSALGVVASDMKAALASPPAVLSGATALLATAAPPQPVPLTREQIDAIWSAQGSFTDRESDYRAFARAIERAHGIGGKP